MTSILTELFDRKKTAKEKLAKKLEFSIKKPLLAIFIDREPSEKLKESLLALLTGASVIDISIIILADDELPRVSRKNIIQLPYLQKNRQLLLEAADISLAFNFNDVEEMLLHGIVPISIKRNEVSDYNPNDETGNGFIFNEENPWAIFAGLIRALETYKFPYDWKHIVHRGMKEI